MNVRSALIETLTEAGGVRVALLFGSTARGHERPDSDVDVGFVPLDAGMSLSDELLLQARLERVAGRPVDLVRLDQADSVLRWRAARDGIVLLSHAPGDAARLLAEIALEHADLAPLVEEGAERWRRAQAARQ
jgi:predicted nucleotidyltransferase